MQTTPLAVTVANQSWHSPSSITQLHTVYAFLPRHHDWGACYRAEYESRQKAKNPLWNELWAWLPHRKGAVPPDLALTKPAPQWVRDVACTEATTGYQAVDDWIIHTSYSDMSSIRINQRLCSTSHDFVDDLKQPFFCMQVVGIPTHFVSHHPWQPRVRRRLFSSL